MWSPQMKRKKQRIVDDIFTKCSSSSDLIQKKKAEEKFVLSRQIAVFCALQHYREQKFLIILQME
jgi:hypothetical protein